VLSTHKAGIFNLTFYNEPYRAHGPLLYVEVNTAGKTMVQGNFSAPNSKPVQFRQLPDDLLGLEMVAEDSEMPMLSLSFPNKDQMQVVS